jgi:8-oxo-dGTP pyrophosphatase MutT (NUDIX family)
LPVSFDARIATGARLRWPAVNDRVHDLRSALAAHPPRRASVDGTRDAAVLVPIVAHQEPALIFTVRTETVRSHRGQISFPGGSVDAGESAQQAALREADEELGLATTAVEVLGELDDVPTFVSGYLIHPFVAWITDPPKLRPNPAEVAEILEVPVADLTEEIRALPGFTHAGRNYPTEAWIWKGHVIWGATARVLRVLLYRLADAGIAEHPGKSPGWPSWPSVQGA